jgi:hypothetical protein
VKTDTCGGRRYGFGAAVSSGRVADGATIRRLLLPALPFLPSRQGGHHDRPEPLELVRGGGNVCRDLGRPDAGLEQAGAMTAAKIIRVPDERKLSTRDAPRVMRVWIRTGFD